MRYADNPLDSCNFTNPVTVLVGDAVFSDGINPGGKNKVPRLAAWGDNNTARGKNQQE